MSDKNIKKEDAESIRTNELLAERIATDILTAFPNRGGFECTRIQLMIGRADGTENIMGGRNKQSIIDVILEHLNG